MLEQIRGRLTLGALAPWALLVAIGILVLYPTYMLLYGSLWSARPGFPGHFTIEHYVATAASLDTYKVLLNSLIIVGGKTILAGIIAVGLAWLVTRTDVPCRTLVEIVA